MRGVYTVRQQISSLSIAKTVLLGEVPSGTIIEILEAYLTNANQNTAEQLDVGLFLVTTLGSAAGTSITASNVQKTEPGSANTVLTWLSDLTTEPTTYNANPLHVDAVINLAGYKYEPMPEARRFVGSGISFGLRLLASPTNAFKAECMITYREIG
jgi:hypothetical protein